MNTNSAFTGHFQENLFHYQKLGLRELRIVRGGRAIDSVDTTNDSRAYVTTMKAMVLAKKFLRYQIIYFRTITCLYLISLHFEMLEKVFVILKSAVKLNH